MEKILQQKLMLCLISYLMIIGIMGCKKEALVSQTGTGVNITGYLDANPDQFSEFRKILEITKTDGFLQAYGNYTLFLPTNDGVKKFLQDMNKSSVSELSELELKNIVKFHLLEDTISTTKFGDGKLGKETMFGQFLITGASSAAGISTITINRQANIVKSNIRLGNGYVHVIDNVLRPESHTLATLLESDSKFSWVNQALKETGLYDTLNILPENNPDTTRKYLTFFGESDDVLKAAGFKTYDEFKTKYNKGNSNLKSPENGLHAYIAYHILYDAKYIADLASNLPISHKTLADPEIITSQLKNNDIILNELIFNYEFEPGVRVIRESSDRSAINGVLHTTGLYSYNESYRDATDKLITVSGTTTGQFGIKPRVPFPVYWDVADFPEMRKDNAGIFRQGTSTKTFTKVNATDPSPIRGWNWPKKGDGVVYKNDSKFVNKDYLNLVLGVGNSRQEWIDMKTPLIVRGKYYVWICYERNNQSSTNWPLNVGTTARVSIDGGDPSPKAFHFTEPAPPGSTADLEAMGWKYYTSTGDPNNPFTKQNQPADGKSWSKVLLSKNIGVMEVKTTGTHTLRIIGIAGSQSTNNLDMIHFIPIDWSSQVLPRFKTDGTMDYTPYDGKHTLP